MGRLVVMTVVVVGLRVVRRMGRVVVSNRVGLVAVWPVIGRRVVVRCGGFFVPEVVGGVGRLIVVGRTEVCVLFSTTSANSWKLSFSDSTILFTNKLILSFSRSSSMNGGVEMSKSSIVAVPNWPVEFKFGFRTGGKLLKSSSGDDGP